MFTCPNLLTGRLTRAAALLILAITTTSALAQKSDTKDHRPSSKTQSTKVVSKAPTPSRYETIRISKPDGSVVTLRVPRSNPLSRIAKPPVYRAVGTPSHPNRLPRDPVTPDQPLPMLHGPQGIMISHPILGRYPLTIENTFTNTLLSASLTARVGDDAAVAGDDPTEWRTGRGWAPGGEDAVSGDYIGPDTYTEFVVLEPGSGWSESTEDPPTAGIPGDDGYDAQAIARWNVVPFQEVNNDFILGVVAFHKKGIKHIRFSLNNGPWFTVTQPALNPRTNTWEYAVTLRPSLLSSDGPVEVRAIVYPVVGEARVLAGPFDGSTSFKNGEHSLFLATNTMGTLPTPVYYCSPEGNDSTGDGSQDNPFRSPARSLQQATVDYGSADGATCYLMPGTYSWGPKPWPLIQTSDRWPILRPAPGISRDQVVIDEGLSGGFSTALIAAHDVTIMGDYTIRGGGQFWLNECAIKGPGVDGPYNSQLFQPFSDWLAEYITACDVTGYRNGVRDATLTRDTFVHDIWGVPFGQTGLLVNSRADVVDAMGTDSHCDVLRWLLSSNELENYIAFGVHVTNADAQGVFAETQPGFDTLNDVALVNVHISQDTDTYNGSWWEPTTNHLLLWHVSMPDQTFRWAQESYNTSLTNVSIIGSVFGAFTYTELPTHDPKLAFVNHIHFVDTDVYQSWFVGLDRSYGNPGFKDPANGDYSLLQTSPLRSRVPQHNQVVTNDLHQLIRGPLTSIGPLATDEEVGTR